MRRLEWALGLLSAVLALAAVVFTSTHRVVQVTVGTAVYGAGVDQGVAVITSLLACCLVVVAALLVALGAAMDARRLAAGLARGGWRWVVMVGAALSIVGVFLLGLSGLWVAIGGLTTAPAAGSLISAALLFTPAALAAVACAVLVAFQRSLRPAPALA